MTAGFFLLVAGTILAVSGFKNVSVVNVLRGDMSSRNSAFGSAEGNDLAGTAQSLTDSIGTSIVGDMSAKGVRNFEGEPVAAWIYPWLVLARKHGWKGKVSSGFRTYQQQVAACAHTSGPCATPGSSNHEGSNFPRGAVDVTEAEQLDRILRALGSPLKWAGAKDPVHFSNPHDGHY